jgi:hypothetical protein
VTTAAGESTVGRAVSLSRLVVVSRFVPFFTFELVFLEREDADLIGVQAAPWATTGVASSRLRLGWQMHRAFSFRG